MLVSDLRVALCQMNSVDDPEKNFAQIESLLSQVQTPVDLVCFPENALYFRIIATEKIPGIEITDPRFQVICEWAKKHSAHVHLGSVPVKVGDKLGNTSLLIKPDGSIGESYSKIHLFDIQLEGHNPIRESDAFAHGSGPRLFQIGDWKIGQTICYDLRFSELYSQYAKADADVILIPSAFLVPTGRDHWDVLVRARAIESQCFVLAAAQAGRHVSVRSQTVRDTYGHSLVVDPWGRKLAEAPESGTQVISVTLSKREISKVREQIPMRAHRRL